MDLPPVTVTVETAYTSPVTYSLEDLKGETGLATRILRPRITVKSGALVLLRVEPAGSPEDGPPLALLLALAVLGALAWKLL